MQFLTVTMSIISPGYASARVTLDHMFFIEHVLQDISDAV